MRREQRIARACGALLGPLGLGLLAALPPLLGGCGDHGSGSPPPASPPRDLALLELMLQVNALHRGMEPVLRSEEHLADLAQNAAGVAALAADPLFAGWNQRPDFLRNKQPFERWRLELLEAATAAQAAAEAGDREALHQAYSRMDGSCIACHKRYLETY